MTVTVRLQKLREEELVRIAFAGEQDGFEGQYIEAAKREIERRGISALTVEELRQESVENKLAENEKANEPLGAPGRALFFIFGVLWLTWFATAALKYQGYDQKYRDSWRWILYGFGFWLFIGLMFMMSDLYRK